MITRWWRAADNAGDGLWLDLGLYLTGALFAGVTAVTSTLAPHRGWGAVAVFGYAAAAAFTVIQLSLFVRRRPGPVTAPGAADATTAPDKWYGTRSRALVAGLAWLATSLLPLVVQASQRVAGRLDRAQEEVLVVEHGGQRLLDAGTPYLARDAIAALPPEEWLLRYLPYQPGMALFGVPRALAGVAWWTDARVWFALATAVALAVAARVLLHPPAPAAVSVPSPVLAALLLRGAQMATVLPVCALTLATGGDDLPVLALCLLALALCARDRFGAAGVAAGLAGALKLFAWPVTAVLLVLALTRGRRALGRFAAGAVGLPLLAVLPALAVDAGAMVDNVVRFPLGDGLVTSPAQSPFPGHLIAGAVPGGSAIATGLLLAAGLAIAAWLARRPPRTAAAAATVCAIGLLAAILLMPSTRFGYLLYPAAFAVWAGALREVTWRRQPTGVTTAGTVEECR